MLPFFKPYPVALPNASAGVVEVAVEAGMEAKAFAPLILTMMTRRTRARTTARSRRRRRSARALVARLQRPRSPRATVFIPSTRAFDRRCVSELP